MGYQSLENRIGMILIERVGLKESDLEDVLRTQKATQKKIGDILIEKNLVKPEDLAKALSIQLGIPYIDDLKTQEIDPKIIRSLQIQYCRENRILPIYEEDKFVRVALVDPFASEVIDAIRFLYGKEVDVVITSYQKLEDAINKVFEKVEDLIKGGEDEDSDEFGDDISESEDLLEGSEDEAIVIKIVRRLLVRAVKEKASDIHIEPFEKNTIVRFRIDGILYDIRSLGKNLHAAISSRIKVMAELNIAEKRIPQDGRVKIRLAGREIDIRVSFIPVAAGERIVLRLLDKSSVILDLEALGFPEESRERVHDLINKKYGIFLVTGPTGSGKSTTLSACLKIISSPERNIITVEDPVEYQLPGVGQIAVNPKVGLTFAAGLRSILRQDPDVVMVGEIRDRETAEIAINASLTGHLVLSTLHTNDAPGAITRLIDMGIEPFLVSSSIVGILAQRLIRKVCQSCAETFEPTEEVLMTANVSSDELRSQFNLSKIRLRKPRGCSECRQTGYRERTAIHELMVVGDSLRQLILQRMDANTIRKQAAKEGLKTLRDSALEKLVLGHTSLEEIIRMTQLEK